MEQVRLARVREEAEDEVKEEVLEEAVPVWDREVIVYVRSAAIKLPIRQGFPVLQGVVRSVGQKWLETKHKNLLYPSGDILPSFFIYGGLIKPKYVFL